MNKLAYYGPCKYNFFLNKTLALPEMPMLFMGYRHKVIILYIECDRRGYGRRFCANWTQLISQCGQNRTGTIWLYWPDFLPVLTDQLSLIGAQYPPPCHTLGTFLYGYRQYQTRYEHSLWLNRQSLLNWHCPAIHRASRLVVKVWYAWLPGLTGVVEQRPYFFRRTYPWSAMTLKQESKLRFWLPFIL